MAVSPMALPEGWYFRNVKNNRSARLQGAMALVACATEELQRLKPHSGARLTP